MHTFTLIFLVFLSASVLTRIWLSRRQVSHIQNHRAQVPQAFAEKISLAEHQKAADYSTTKLHFGRLTLAGREGDVEEAAAAAMHAIQLINR